MDWLGEFITKYKEWLLALFGGGGVVAIAWVFGFFRWLWERLIGRPTAPSATAIDQRVERGDQTLQVGQAVGDVHYHAGAQVNVGKIVDELLETYKQRLAEADRRTVELETQNRQLVEAVNELAKKADAPDAPPAIDAALKQLAEGETGAAENIFQRVLEEQKRAEGEAASKEAAAAARHIGALAYLHDTQKALSAYAQAVELDPENPDGWNHLGQLHYRVGNLDGAIKAFERILALGNKVDDKAVVAMAYGNLGLVYRTRGDLAKAEEYHLKSLALNEELGRKEGMADQYGNLGNIHQTRGDLAKAEEFHLKSLAIEEELGRKEGMASDYGNLGVVYRKRGDLAKAEEYYLKSLAIEMKLVRKEGMATQYGNLGIVYGMRGDLEKAEEYHLKSLAIEEELGRKEGMARTHGNLGNNYFRREDLAKAEEYYLKSLALDEELGRKEGVASTYGNLGNVYQTRGDLAKACEAWAKSRRLFEKLGAKDRAEQVRGLMEESGCG